MQCRNNYRNEIFISTHKLKCNQACRWRSELTVGTAGFRRGAVSGDDRITAVICCVVCRKCDIGWRKWSREKPKTKLNKWKRQRRDRAPPYTGGVGTRSPVSPGSCCRSSVRPISSPHSSRPLPPQGGRPHWAPAVPS